MKKPMFKFELAISEVVEVTHGLRVDESGAFVPDPHFSVSGAISKSGFLLTEDLYGLNVTITEYEIVGQTLVFEGQQVFSSFGPFDNTGYSFDDANRRVVVSVEHADVKVNQVWKSVNIDGDNLISFIYKVHPVFSKLKKVYDRDGTEMYMRAKLQGDISFMAGAFDKLASLDMNNGVVLRVYKKDPSTGQYSQFYVTKKFTKADCTFDYDRRSVKINTEPYDRYTNVLAGMNTEFDLNRINPQWCKAKYKIPPLKQFYVYGTDKITNMVGESFFSTDSNFPELEAGQNYFQVLTEHMFARAAFFTEIRYHQVFPELTGGQAYDFSFHCQSSYTYPGAPYPTGLIPHSYAFAPSYIPYKMYYNGTTGQIEIQDYDTGSVVAASIDNTETSLIAHGLTGLKIYKDGMAIGVITGVIDYDIYQRTLYHADGQIGPFNPFAPISDDDFAYSGSVYNYAENTFAYCPQIYATADLSDKPGEFALMKSPMNYFTNAPLPHGGLNERYVPVCPDSWSGISLWVSGSAHYSNIVDAFGYDFENDRCVTVMSAIRAILSEIAPEIRIADTAAHSEFLYGLYNPIGLPELCPILTHSSNITAGAFGQAAQRGKIKLRDLLDLVRNAMELYWYIDDDNAMHVEHVSWFLNGGTYGQRVAQIDIRGVKDSFNGKILDTGQGSLKYDRSGMYSNLRLFADEDTTDASAAVSTDIYDMFVRGTGSNEVGLGSFKVNLDYMFATGSADSHEDGFAFILARKVSGANATGEYLIPRDTYTNPDMVCDCGSQYNIKPLNTYAMPRFLMNYRMLDFYGRSLSGKAYQVRGVMKARRQTVTLPCEIELDPYGFIRTRFGRGLIDRITTDFDTQYSTIELLYDAGDYPWAYTDPGNIPVPMFDLVSDVEGLVDDDPYVYIGGSDRSFPIYSIPSLADMLRNFPDGVVIGMSCVMNGPTTPQSGTFPIFFSTIPDSAISPSSTYFAGIATLDAANGGWRIDLGLANCNFATGTYVMQEESCSLLVGYGTEFGMKLQVRLVGGDIRLSAWIADGQGSGRFSGVTPFTARLSENANPIAIASNVGNRFLRFRNLTVTES